MSAWGVFNEFGFSAGLADALIFVWVAPGSKLNTLIEVVVSNSLAKISARPFKPNFGGSIRNLLFELNTDRQINRMKITLAKEIEVLEPRVNNVQVALSNQDNNKLDMTIFYNITNGSPNQEIEINVSRTR